MFKIGSLVNVFYSVESFGSFIAKIVGFDYDKEVVFVYTDFDITYEVPFGNIDPV